MDITPNMTTVVQILNFGIAYGVIRVFLCRPVVALLQQEEDQINHLQIAIATHTQLVDTTKENLYRQWYAQHQFFINNRPVLEPATLLVQTPSLQVRVRQELLGAEELDSIVRGLTDSIVNKVLYGNK